MKIYNALMGVFFLVCSVNGEEDFGSLLNEATAIATKTKLNIDYQPSVVSVLHADKLKKLGITNLYEAIGTLPGIETSKLHTGWKQVIIRGIHNPDTFVFDKYKLYIDGVDVGSDLYSTSYYYLDFPVELIERIEVLRGSASTIYGSGAFSGAINVITKSALTDDTDTIFGSAGSYGYTKAGFVKHMDLGDWKLGIDSYHQHSNKTLNAGEGFVAAKESAYVRSDYDSLENFEDYSIGVNAQYHDWTLIARYKSEVTDNFYGLNETLEPVNGGYQRNKSGIIEIQNTAPVAQDMALESKFGINYYAFTFDSTIYQDYEGTGLRVRMNPTYEQLNSYMEINLKGQNFTDHDWRVGGSAQKINTIKNVFGTTLRTQGDGGPFVYNTMEYLDGKYGFLRDDNDQWVKSAYAQDIYSLSDAIDLSGNVRIDSYALFGSMLSYRFGGVYRLDESNIFKAIYGRSFRAPSYVEAFQSAQDGIKNGTVDLRAESIDTYEVGYTYKEQNTIFRTNVFYSVLKEVIDALQNEPASVIGDYSNNRARSSKGLETEITHHFSNGSELMANVSYIRAAYFSPDYYTPVEYRSPEVSEVMFKGYYLYPLNEKLGLNTAWYYNGSKRGYDRTNGNIQHYGATRVIDETLSYDVDESSMMTLSVKNLFNERIVYPSYQGKHEGLQREGRNWLLTYEKRF